MSDLISRKAVIDYIMNAADGYDYIETRTDKMIEDIKKIPSAEPEPITLNIDHELTKEEYEKLRKDMADAPIVLLPSAEPERKKGRWIFKAEEYYKAVNEKGGGVNENTPFFTDDIACPECLSMFSVIDNEAERFNFCPWCGADMRGNDGETESH